METKLEYTCVIGGYDFAICQSGGHITAHSCGTKHRSLEAAIRCCKRHTRRTRSVCPNSCAYEPVQRERGYEAWHRVARVAHNC